MHGLDVPLRPRQRQRLGDIDIGVREAQLVPEHDLEVTRGVLRTFDELDHRRARSDMQPIVQERQDRSGCVRAPRADAAEDSADSASDVLRRYEPVAPRSERKQEALLERRAVPPTEWNESILGRAWSHRGLDDDQWR